MKILIENATILVNDKMVKDDIFIEKGRIKKIGKADSTADLVINGKGLTVLPAFVDMHCHLREPGQEYKEDIVSGAQSACAGGFCAIACMPNTEPVMDSATVVSFVVNRAKETPIRIYPIGAITKGQRSEELAPFEQMKRYGVVALSDDGKPVIKGALMKNALEYASSLNIPIIAHSEDLSISDGGLVNEGLNATISGLTGIPNASEEAGIARDIFLAKSANAPIHIAHVSTKGGVELIRQAKKHGIRVTAETCPHYFALDDSEILGFNTLAKINPPLRSKEDVEAVIEGLVDGTIDAIATDHAPHHVDEKMVEFSRASFGSIGFECAFSASYTHLVKTGKLKLNKLSKLMTENPSRILNIPCPKIAENAEADLVIVNLNASTIVGENGYVSKAKNCVFEGKQLLGTVEYTIAGGRLVYQKQ